MPGFTPADGDLVQLRTCSYTPTQISLNILNYQQFSHVNAGLTVQEIATAFDGLVNLAYKNWMSTQARWRGVGAVNLMAPQTVEYISIGNDAIGNTGVANAPTQTSGLLTYKTSLRGRRYVGHSYIGFPSVDFMNAAGGMNALGLFTVTGIAFLFGPTITLTVGANSVTMYLAVRHPDAVVAGIRIPQWTTVFTILPAPLFATRRSRGQFGKENLPPF